jgi:hypothetical protein
MNIFLRILNLESQNQKENEDNLFWARDLRYLYLWIHQSYYGRNQNYFWKCFFPSNCHWAMGLIRDCTKKDCKTAKLKLQSSCKCLQCTQNQTLLQVYWSFVLCENGKRKIWPQAELSLRFTMINTTIVLQYNTSHYGYVA